MGKPLRTRPFLGFQSELLPLMWCICTVFGIQGNEESADLMPLASNPANQSSYPRLVTQATEKLQQIKDTGISLFLLQNSINFLVILFQN